MVRIQARSQEGRKAGRQEGRKEARKEERKKGRKARKQEGRKEGSSIKQTTLSVASQIADVTNSPKAFCTIQICIYRSS